MERRFLPRPWWAVVTLLVSVAYTPLALYAGQGFVLARGYRLIWYTFVVTLGLAGGAWIIARAFRVRLATAWFALSLAWLVFSAGGRLADDLGAWLMMALIVVLAAVVLLLDASRFLDTLMVALTVYLVFASVSGLTGTRDPGDREAASGVVTAESTGATIATPDVWFLVLDGYPSETSRVHDFGGGEASLASTLAEHQFVVQGDALAPYTRTVGALPSILSGTMIFPAGSIQDEADMVAAAEIVGGASTLVSGLEDVGYHVTMVESGWHLSHCGPAIDTCIGSALLDEMGSALVSASILPRVVGIDRHVSSVIGTERTFAALNQLSVTYADNGRPDLVFAHSLAPHPPMLLDADCVRQGPAPDRSSLLLSFNGWDDELIAARAATFIDQVACVDKLVLSFVESLPAEAAVIIVGDHGSEVRGQVSLPAEDWDDDMLRERLQTLAAVRIPGCAPVVQATVQIVGELFACIGLRVHEPVLAARIMANAQRADGSEFPLFEVPPDRLRLLIPEGNG